MEDMSITLVPPTPLMEVQADNRHHTWTPHLDTTFWKFTRGHHRVWCHLCGVLVFGLELILGERWVDGWSLCVCVCVCVCARVYLDQSDGPLPPRRACEGPRSYFRAYFRP